MHIAFKISCWEQLRVPEEIEKEVEEKVRAKLIESINDVYNEFPEYGDFNWNKIDDTDESMMPIENDGQATVELYDDNGKTIWDNYIEDFKKEEIIVEVRGGIAYATDPRIVIKDYDNEKKG